MLSKAKHPISQDCKVVWEFSRTTRDLCYTVPALLASFRQSFSYYLAVLAYGLLAFLLTTFFEIAV